ncbi:MAG: hypothetical protein J6W98_00935 [Bacteroidales bacterium]|nr:hypothetical protein [Bacteroidales bacterium]
MKRCFFFLLTAILTAVSCSTPRYVSSQPDMQDQWIDRSHAEIIREFGAPTREHSDGANGKILVYERFETTSHTSEFMGSYSTTVENNRIYKEFYLDADDYCYDVRTNEVQRDGNRFSFFKSIVLVTGIGVALLPFYGF